MDPLKVMPDGKQMNNFSRFFMQYVVIGLVAAVVWLFMAFVNLNNYVRTDLLQRQIRNESALDANTRATESFLNYQRFMIPIRREPDTTGIK